MTNRSAKNFLTSMMIPSRSVRTMKLQIQAPVKVKPQPLTVNVRCGNLNRDIRLIGGPNSRRASDIDNNHVLGYAEGATGPSSVR